MRARQHLVKLIWTLLHVFLILFILYKRNGCLGQSDLGFIFDRFVFQLVQFCFIVKTSGIVDQHLVLCSQAQNSFFVILKLAHQGPF